MTHLDPHQLMKQAADTAGFYLRQAICTVEEACEYHPEMDEKFRDRFADLVIAFMDICERDFRFAIQHQDADRARSMEAVQQQWDEAWDREISRRKKTAR